MSKCTLHHIPLLSHILDNYSCTHTVNVWSTCVNILLTRLAYNASNHFFALKAEDEFELWRLEVAIWWWTSPTPVDSSFNWTFLKRYVFETIMSFYVQYSNEPFSCFVKLFHCGISLCRSYCLWWLKHKLCYRYCYYCFFPKPKQSTFLSTLSRKFISRVNTSMNREFALEQTTTILLLKTQCSCTHQLLVHSLNT